jgi:hypothetical protein
MYNKEYYKNFRTRLRKFQPYEIIASEKIILLYGEDTIEFNNDYAYDFKHKNILYEVKADQSSVKTGNFYIAFFDVINNRPSQLSITKSNYYIITDKTNYYLVSTINLKALVENKEYRVVKNFEKSAIGYIVPRNDIIALSIIL